MKRTKQEIARYTRQSYRAKKVYQEYYSAIIKGLDIHHKDRDRDNNHPDNLEALTRSEHIKRHSETDFLWGWSGYHQGDFERSLKNLELELYFYNNNIIKTGNNQLIRRYCNAKN